jgi:L-seryl-tRNA(Ser) seleniumtransferase
VGAREAAAGDLSARLRELPSVERLAAALEAPHRVAVAAARAAIEDERSRILGGEPTGSLVARARELLAASEAPSLRHVVNATGVILHTNLGRAPLARAAREAVARAAEGYSNLELDLSSGERGSRQAHVEGLLAELSGAEAALAVNNCAGAVLLAAAALATGRSVVVSRGQLVEIGGAFRIPEVVAQSGARLVEVGTTNRTRLSDYERALAALEPGDPGVILRAHASNYRVVGFVEEVPIEELCRLGVPVIDDAGSGNVADELEALAGEPPVRRSVAGGAALVCFSGDKLLGGPQAGLLVGRRDAVAAARAHPLARALRVDKLSLAALEATLRLYRDPERARRELPVLAMLTVPSEELERRAARLRAALDEGSVRAELLHAVARVGGGALPLLELEGPAVAVDPSPLSAAELTRRLRASDPPVIARIERDAVFLDPRTMSDEEAAAASRAVVVALREAPR